MNVVPSSFTVDEIFSAEILLILDSLISAGNMSSVVSFVKNTYASFLNRYILSLLEWYKKRIYFLQDTVTVFKCLCLCAVSIFVVLLVILLVFWKFSATNALSLYEAWRFSPYVICLQHSFTNMCYLVFILDWFYLFFPCKLNSPCGQLLIFDSRKSPEVWSQIRNLMEIMYLQLRV